MVSCGRTVVAEVAVASGFLLLGSRQYHSISEGLLYPNVGDRSRYSDLKPTFYAPFQNSVILRRLKPAFSGGMGWFRLFPLLLCPLRFSWEVTHAVTLRRDCTLFSSS